MGIQIGDRIRDNDPRSLGSTRIVTAISPPTMLEHRRVSASLRGGSDKTGETRIRLDRIHTDGKPRRSGWSLVIPNAGDDR